MDGGAEGRIPFSCSSPGRGMGRLCWRMCQRMARNFLVAWGDTRTQVRGRVGWVQSRRREAISLGLWASGVGVPGDCLPYLLPTKDQAKEG